MKKNELFNKMINNAMEAKDEDLAELICDCIDSFRKYVNSVIEMEIRIPMARFRMELEELQRFVEELDKTRRVCHEKAIDSCNILNRICVTMKLEKFFDGNTENRYEVADFCIEMVSELFKDGQKINIQEQASKREYIAPKNKEV